MDGRIIVETTTATGEKRTEGLRRLCLSDQFHRELGLKLEQGKALPAQLRRFIPQHQIEDIFAASRPCPCCGRTRPVHDYRARVPDTLLGRFRLRILRHVENAIKRLVQRQDFPGTAAIFMTPAGPPWFGIKLRGRWRDLYSYAATNGGAVARYGRQFGQGLPISTSRAEGCVDDIGNTRMGKRLRMRWSPQGARTGAVTRAAVLDGRLSVCNRKIAA